MHYHCEIVMPSGFDIEQSIKEIMEPFDEKAEERNHPFWDWWVIGGRWSGSKLEARLDPEKLEKFGDHLREIGITCSGLRAGKQELNPPEQIPVVDKLWQEWFPESGIKVCPLFKHANDQYSNLSLIDGDIATLGAVSTNLKAAHVILAARDYDNKKMEATFMVTEDVWNGCNHQKTEWNGTLKHALELFSEKSESYSDSYKERATPRPDWLVVTVDYHS